MLDVWLGLVLMVDWVGWLWVRDRCFVCFGVRLDGEFFDFFVGGDCCL